MVQGYMEPITSLIERPAGVVVTSVLHVWLPRGQMVFEPRSSINVHTLSCPSYSEVEETGSNWSSRRRWGAVERGISLGAPVRPHSLGET